MGPVSERWARFMDTTIQLIPVYDYLCYDTPHIVIMNRNHLKTCDNSIESENINIGQFIHKSVGFFL